MGNFEPLNEVKMYQARCTGCGIICDEMGDFSAYADDDMAVAWVEENVGWYRLGDDWPPKELLCEKCQRCEVCGAEQCYRTDDEQHLACTDHEDHEFAVSVS